MEISLIFIACFVNFGSTFAQSHNQVDNRAFNDKVIEKRSVQDNERGIYGEALEQEAASGQQAFRAMEDELRTARERNLDGKTKFRHENFVARKREIDTLSTTTTARQYTLKPPVDLHDIGYNGTWQQFCDKDEINKDSPPFPDHPLRTIRLYICYRQDLNKWTWETQSIFAEYKYCLRARPQADAMLERLVARLSEGDEEKKAALFELGLAKPSSMCFRDCQEWIRNFCVDRDNPYFTMMYDLLTKACNVPWLKPVTKIRTIMIEECRGKRIPQVQWIPILASIGYTERRNIDQNLY